MSLFGRRAETKIIFLFVGVVRERPAATPQSRRLSRTPSSLRVIREPPLRGASATSMDVSRGRQISRRGLHSLQEVAGRLCLPHRRADRPPRMSLFGRRAETKIILLLVGVVRERPAAMLQSR